MDDCECPLVLTLTNSIHSLGLGLLLYQSDNQFEYKFGSDGYRRDSWTKIPDHGQLRFHCSDQSPSESLFTCLPVDDVRVLEMHQHLRLVMDKFLWPYIGTTLTPSDQYRHTLTRITLDTNLSFVESSTVHSVPSALCLTFFLQ